MEKQEFNIRYKYSFWVNIGLELIWCIYFIYRAFMQREVIGQAGFGFLALILGGFAWGTITKAVKTIAIDEKLTVSGFTFGPKVFSKVDIKQISMGILAAGYDKYVIDNTALNELMLRRLLRFCEVENPIEAYESVIKGKKVIINGKSDSGSSSGSLQA